MADFPISKQGMRQAADSVAASRAERQSLRVSGILLLVGVLVSLVSGISHPDRVVANDHVAAFTEYANTGTWVLVHFGQFVGMAFLIAGLLALYVALGDVAGIAAWTGRFAAITAIIALAMYGVLQAVDGVALKHAVDAWLSAPEADKPARFASAEVIRWLEWGVRSYQSFILGLSFVLFAITIGSTARLPKPIGLLLGVAGLAYFAQGWIIGVEGFSASNTLPTLIGVVMVLATTLSLLFIAWRMSDSATVPKSTANSN